MEIPTKRLLETSFIYFAKNIYGLRMSSAHMKMADHVETAGNRSLLLCNRGIGKSVILQAFITWQLLKNPNTRICLVSSTDGKARTFMRAIKQTLETQKVIDIWGSQVGSTWTDHEITLSGRTEIHAESSLMCLGAGSGSITGRHFSIAVIDDICDFDSTRSELQRDRLREWYLSSFMPTMLADGKIIAAGTRYHYMDIWQLLSERLNYNTLILPPIKPDGTAQCEFLQPLEDVVKSDGSVIVRGLKSIKHDLGSVIYALQFENDVSLLLEGNIINKTFIQYYTQLPALKTKIITCDPAISKSDGADYTAIIVGGQAEDGNIYVIDYVQARLSFHETVEKLKSLVHRYNPDEVRIEQVAFSEAFITELKRKIPTTIIRGVKPMGDKESRLREVSPIMENMLVWFKSVHEPIIAEMLLFPGGDHDDLCDGMQLFLAYYKVSHEPGVIIW